MGWFAQWWKGRAPGAADELGAGAPQATTGAQATAPEPDGDGDPDPDAPAVLPIDGALDLHHFRPRDLRTLVPAYLRECQARDILEVRVIHGKGKGQLRRSVHALLERDPIVADYGLCPPERGGWGATLVHLRPAADQATTSVARPAED